MCNEKTVIFMRRLILRQIICAIVLLACSACASSKYRGVVITGQNNHYWQTSSQAIKLILDNTGMFETDIAVSPAKGEDMSSFSAGCKEHR